MKDHEFEINSKNVQINPTDTGRKLNVHKTFRRRLGHFLNVLCTFNLRPVSMGNVMMQVWELQLFRMKNLRVHFHIFCSLQNKSLSARKLFPISLTSKARNRNSFSVKVFEHTKKIVSMAFEANKIMYAIGMFWYSLIWC